MASREVNEGALETGGIRKGERSEDVPYRTTLSTSTSSFEALDPHDPQLNRLASVAFSGEDDKWKISSQCHSQLFISTR